MMDINLPEFISLQKINSNNGIMLIAESHKNVHFEFERIFIIEAGKGDIRGMHAHRQCQQLLICSFGEIEVSCTNGAWNRLYSLNNSTDALLIPAGVWATQKYIKEKNILTVICDTPYQESDYIRDFSVYLKEYHK